MRNRHTLPIAFQVLGDMGNLIAATHSLSAIKSLYPRQCFLIGLAGSLNSGTVNLGDVAVATSVKAFYPDKVKRLDPDREIFGSIGDNVPGKIIVDSRKRIFAESFLRFRRVSSRWPNSAFQAARYMSYLESTRAQLPLNPVANISGLAAQFENRSPKIFQATVFGSDMVIDSDEFVNFLSERNTSQDHDYYRKKSGDVAADRRNTWLTSELTVVDMESLGYFMIAHALGDSIEGTQYYSVRGVSDFSSGKDRLQELTAGEVRRCAMMNALTVTLDMIEFFAVNRVQGMS
jgi:hypothetical protein